MVVIEPLTAISLSMGVEAVSVSNKYLYDTGQFAEQKVPSVLLVDGGLFQTVDE